jgi:hypothetical protein
MLYQLSYLAPAACSKLQIISRDCRGQAGLKACTTTVKGSRLAVRRIRVEVPTRIAWPREKALREPGEPRFNHARPEGLHYSIGVWSA